MKQRKQNHFNQHPNRFPWTSFFQENPQNEFNMTQPTTKQKKLFAWPDIIQSQLDAGTAVW